MLTEPPLIEIPYGRGIETVQSPRYHWACWDRDRAPFVILQYTLAGAGWFETGGRRMEVTAGNAFVALVPEQAAYGFPSGSRTAWSFCWLNFYGEPALALWRSLRERHGPVLRIPLQSAAGRHFRRLAIRVDGGPPMDRFERATEGYALWVECLRSLGEGSTPDPLEDPEAFAARHLRAAVAVKEMAAGAGMSREHFSRRFREQHGTGPATWLRRWRVRAARRLLREADLPLAEVALRCGFGGTRQLGRALRAMPRTRHARLELGDGDGDGDSGESH